jgi:hypothetical protein
MRARSVPVGCGEGPQECLHDIWDLQRFDQTYLFHGISTNARVDFDSYINDMAHPVLGYAMVTKSVDDPGDTSCACGKVLASFLFPHDEGSCLVLFACLIDNQYRLCLIARTLDFS